MIERYLARWAHAHARYLRAEDGVASIELALLAPILVAMLICTADLGIGIYRKMQVQNAAQAGAAYAARNGFNTDAITAVITSAAYSFTIDASPAPRRFCGCAAELSVTAISCDTSCDGGVAPGTYVESSAQGVYTTLIPYPLFENSFTFMAQSTVRLQ